MDVKPKKRRWLQLHLSTCIVLMFVAGGLTWANMIVRETEVHRQMVQASERLKQWQLENPHTVLMGMIPSGPTTEPYFIMGFPLVIRSEGHGDLYPPKWHSWGIVGNIAVGIGILIGFSVPCEVIIRHLTRLRSSSVR